MPLGPEVDAALARDVRAVAELALEDAAEAEGLPGHRHADVHADHARRQLLLAPKGPRSRLAPGFLTTFQGFSRIFKDFQGFLKGL